MMKKIYNWTMALAEHRHAVYWLAIVSFVESSVFPIPPDALLIPMVLAARQKAWRYASICTISSVVGGMLGYAIGHFLFAAIGQPIFEMYNLMPSFLAFKEKFNEYGAWIVLIKGMTPIPYKLITIAAGSVDMNIPIFMASSIVSRALRFFLVAALLWKFGEPIRIFIEKRLTLLTTLFALAIVVGFLALKYI